jgi:MG2 domain/Macroglobulin domain MG3
LTKKFVNLDLSFKKFSVLVQTDKAQYKPSDKVQFRVLFVNADTQSVNIRNISLVITDGDKNRVKQFSNVGLVKGVYQGQFQLSDLAVLGEWQILVSVNGVNTETKSFEVAKYTLPTFDLKIESDPLISYKEGIVSVKVLARYTFGKLATGTATVTATTFTSFGPRPIGGPAFRRPISRPLTVISKEADIDGKKPVTFDIENDLKLTDKTASVRVRLQVSFVEGLTGRRQNATESIEIRPTTLTISEFFRENRQFEIKPKLPFLFEVTLKDKEIPVTGLKVPVVFNVTYFSDKLKTCGTAPKTFQCREEVTTNKIFRDFPKAGFAKFTFEIDQKTTRVEIKSTYGSAERLSFYGAARSKSGQYIQVTLKNPK